MIEGTNIEFKELDRQTGKIPETALKEVVAFLNTDGGSLYIGIRDDRTIAGVEDTDDVMKRLSNMIADSIKPNPLQFIRIDAEEMEGKNVIKCSVSLGIERPYFLSKKGLTAEGVYVRIGSTSRNVNESAIRQMIIESSGKSYEECRSLEQNLTFTSMKEEMEKRSLAFDTPQMKTLGMIGEDGLFTNLALLLSDQCPFVTKVAEFDGDVFRDRQQFTGSLFKQLNDVYYLLNMNNKTQASFEGLIRTDVRDYPPDALREALLNSIVHRSYTFTDGNIINIRENQIEIVSLGGLVPNISYDAIFMGLSQSRNPNLAAVFYRLRLIESYGTGIQKILREYAKFGLKPDFQTAEGVFKVVLPNIHFNEKNKEHNEQKKKEQPVMIKSDPSEKLIEMLKLKKVVTRKEVEEELKIGTTRAFTLLKKLCDEGLAVQEKNGRLTVYSLKE